MRQDADTTTPSAGQGRGPRHELTQAEWRRLVRVAYRFVGCIADAEDAAQETCLRLQRVSDESIGNRQAWLTRVCTRVCLDQQKRAARRRELPAGEWLPEVLVDGSADRVEFDETLSLAFVAAMQQLRETERAVFLLHDVFGDTYGEVGEALGLRPDNCRKIGSRARQRLSAAKTVASSDAGEHSRLTEAFFSALGGEVSELRSLLATDVTLRACGGNGASVIRSPYRGADRVARFFHRVSRSPAWRRTEALPAWFSGMPGVLLLEQGQVVSAYQLTIRQGQIAEISVQRDPVRLHLAISAVTGPVHLRTQKPLAPAV